MSDQQALTIAAPSQPAIASELSLEALAERTKKIHAAIRGVLVENRDFGKIPGCGPKPTLFKSGAELLALMFGFAPTFDVERSDLEDGHREVSVKCTLRHLATGIDVGQGIGSCSTLETKYRYRRGAENPNIADTYNVVAKMATKRAFVAAVLIAAGASGVFTQDIEDTERDTTPETEHRQTGPRSGVKQSAATEAQEPDAGWVIGMVGKLDDADSMEALKPLAAAINKLTPTGSPSRKACRAAYDQALTRLGGTAKP